MRVLKVFIFGLLYGWVLKIAFDRIYRENDMEDLRNENASLREYIHSLELQVERAARPPVVEVTAPVLAVPVQATPEKDNLKVIKGIGPAIEKKLNNAGITTFEALAGLTTEELENILGTMIRRLQDEASLIAQAKELARQK